MKTSLPDPKPERRRCPRGSPYIALLLLLPSTANTGEQDQRTNSHFLSPHDTAVERFLITDAYRKQIIGLLLSEASQVAQALRLPEKLPITEPDLVSTYVSPPALGLQTGATGNVATRSYRYFASVGHKLSYVEMNFGDGPNAFNRDYEQLYRQYLRPLALLNTNAAYQLATQWLSAAHMDVQALNSTCRVSVSAWIPPKAQGKQFVPLYWVVWSRNGLTAASVELLEPTRSLRQLRVETPEYILRKTLSTLKPRGSDVN